MWLDASGKAIPHHEVVPLAQLDDESADVAEFVAVVGVAHDDEVPARCGDPADERAPVPLGFYSDHARAHLFRDESRLVIASVVRDDDLARDAELPQRTLRLLDAPADRLRLVEAGHHDRELDLVCDQRRSSELGFSDWGVHHCGGGIGTFMNEYMPHTDTRAPNAMSAFHPPPTPCRAPDATGNMMNGRASSQYRKPSWYQPPPKNTRLGSSTSNAVRAAPRNTGSFQSAFVARSSPGLVMKTESPMPSGRSTSGGLPPVVGRCQRK